MIVAMNITLDFDDILLFVEEMLWAVSDVLSEERDKALRMNMPAYTSPVATNNQNT
jgi:hypothetical protein